MVAYIRVKIREEAYNCKFCPDLKTHLEVCTLKSKNQTCLRCGYEWNLKYDFIPNRCPNCQSKYWNVIIQPRPNLGEKNGQWKGDKVTYEALHGWVRRNKPQVFLCENCNKNKSYDLANISGEYKRDVNDFKWLCRKCHMIEDGRMNNLIPNVKLSKKICQSCKKSYQPKSSKQKYCNLNCFSNSEENKQHLIEARKTSKPFTKGHKYYPRKSETLKEHLEKCTLYTTKITKTPMKRKLKVKLPILI